MATVSETLNGYVDGTLKDKYDDNFEGFEVNKTYNCTEAGCHYNLNSSVGSDGWSHESKTNAVHGDGYLHKQQVLHGGAIEHEGTFQIGEGKIGYGGEAVIPFSYDQTGYGGSIGPKAKVFVNRTVHGHEVGASAEIGLEAEGGYNSYEKNVGLKAVTIKGAYGVKVGCETEVCFVACVYVRFC